MLSKKEQKKLDRLKRKWRENTYKRPEAVEMFSLMKKNKHNDNA